MGKASRNKKTRSLPGEFLIGTVKVKTGDWVETVCPVGGNTINARICDNHVADGGLMVYWYNPYYPNGHEAGWMTARDYPVRPALELDIQQIPADAIAGAENFLQRCIRGNFE